MWLRNVRFWYHILVLFIIVIVGMQTCCHEPTHENPRWRLSPEIVKPSEHHVYEIQKAILTFSGAPQSNGHAVRPAPPDNDQRQKSNMPPKILQ